MTDIRLEPKVDENRGFRWYGMSEIYTGPTGTGVLVPNPGDAVLDWATGIWRVVSVDTYNTNLSLMTHVNPFTLGGGVTDGDLSIVTSVGSNHANFRIYVNTKKVPHELMIDTRCYWNGSKNAYVKVFLGTNIDGPDAMVISTVLNQAGKPISENIELENIIIPNGVNVAMKTAKTAHCSYTPNDGDTAMVVTYTADGVVASVDRFIIKITNAIRTLDQAKASVTNIELKSPFLSATDKRVIECPINMITQSLQFTGVVSYSDGKSVELPVDGTRFALGGKDFLVSSQIDQIIPVTLFYHLGPGEVTTLPSTEPLPNRTIRVPYKIRVKEIDTFYSVKLFACPVWAINKYVLNYYLYDLERKSIQNVTEYVKFGPSSPVFDGAKFNGVQNIIVSINLKELGQTYANFQHVQPLAISLINPGSKPAVDTYYTLAYNNDRLFGKKAVAIYSPDTANVGKTQLDVSCGNTDYLQWIDRVYRELEPLYLSTSESQAPAPTHVKLKVGTSFQREIPIGDITKPIPNVNIVTFSQGMSVILEMFARDSSGDKQLAVCTLVCKPA